MRWHVLGAWWPVSVRTFDRSVRSSDDVESDAYRSTVCLRLPSVLRVRLDSHWGDVDTQLADGRGTETVLNNRAVMNL